MTKPEFPDTDPPSINPKEIGSNSSEESTHPSFDIDSEGQFAQKKKTEPSYPELFPMPGMTVGNSESHSSAPKNEVDIELKNSQSSLIDEPEDFPKPSNPIQGESPSISTQTGLQKGKMPLGMNDPEHSADDLSGALNPPKQAETAKVEPSPIESTSKFAAISVGSSSDDAKNLNNTASTEINSPVPDQQTPSSQPKSKSQISKPNNLLKTTKQWGKKVANIPVVKAFTAFTGWPWVIALGVSGATTMSAFAWLAGLPPVPDCKNPSASWTASGKLYCADQAARKKEPQALASALDMVGDWDKEDPLYDQVNKLSDDWSRSILDVAQRELDQGKLNEAIQLVEKVPKSSSYYDESRATIKDWQSNWKDGEKILEKARDAIQEQNWAIATDQMRQLVQLGGEHWPKRADKLISEMTIEQDAFRKLNVANDRAGYDTVSDIQSAIQLATQIDAKRLARKKLVTYIDRWSEQLIDLADYYYEIGDYDTAIEAAKAVPPGSKVEPDAIAYLQASRAQSASKEENPLGFIQAVAYTSQLPKSAAVRDIAQDDINEWESQVQSWAQLEFAKMFTRVDQEAGYKIAIDHAALIDTENPNRIKAQSLIAQWDKQLNSVADRQTIARAAQLAERTDLASVHAAIAEARRVKVESPLRIRAQTLIAEWEGSIEKREDQPILDAAIAQAKKGDLNAAINTAEKIASNRALYPEAQDKIYDWVSKIQIAEDDPILNEAAALARQGQLSAAIAKASEVGYGRALYYEAQDLIGGWIAERNRIEAARRPPEPEPERYYEEEQPYEPEEQYYEPQSAPPPEEPYYPPQEEYVDSASGAGISGGPGF